MLTCIPCHFAGRRPSVIISYVVSGVAALCAAASFAELSSEYPVSGGAFSFVMVGRLAPWHS